jgi:hypothetical protein
MPIHHLGRGRAKVGQKEDEVRRRFGSWARPIAGLVTLTLALAVAAPSSATEATASAPPQTLAASAKATVAAKPLPAGAKAQAAPAAGAPTTGESKGFFKTPAGKLAIVLMAAGTGYMVYSAFKDNDSVASPIR